MSLAAAVISGPEGQDFYVRSMNVLKDAGVPFLVGGSYAFSQYTGIDRHSKDFDLFLCRSDYDRAADSLKAAGYLTELTYPHWLGKAFRDDDFVDLIFGAGNGTAEVDELWFRYAVPAEVFGVNVELIPVEEMIWSKGLIMERERFDGADVAHLIHAMAERLDWWRLIDRFGEYWRALFAHIILFGFIYPSDRTRVPSAVIEELTRRVLNEAKSGNSSEKICYGTIISRQQYLKDIEDWGYGDARLKPRGTMSEDEIKRWTAGITIDGAK